MLLLLLLNRLWCLRVGELSWNHPPLPRMRENQTRLDSPENLDGKGSHHDSGSSHCSTIYVCKMTVAWRRFAMEGRSGGFSQTMARVIVSSSPSSWHWVKVTGVSQQAIGDRTGKDVVVNPSSHCRTFSRGCSTSSSSTLN
jgi:hypothetical protein